MRWNCYYTLNVCDLLLVLQLGVALSLRDYNHCVAFTFAAYTWTTKLVLTSSTSANLLTVTGLRGMCDFVDKLVLPLIPVACPAVSVATYVAQLRNTTCSQINADDVSFARDLLDLCQPFFASGKLHRAMAPYVAQRAGVPERCYQTDFVYDVMYYFADIGFYDTSHDLLYTMVYLHYTTVNRADNTAVDNKFYEVSKDLSNNIVELVTVGFYNHAALKYTVFESYLISDLSYFGLAIVLIALFALIYLLSFGMVVGTFVNILLSFGFAYFLYFYLCQMVFYPFINLLALLLLIAIGADDVFVYYDAWQHVKSEHPTWTTEQRLSATFSHAILSIFVTSFTTAAAFLANVVSDITALRCFGIFAALSIVANFAMMVTIMPAIAIATETCAARVTCPWHASTFGGLYRIPNKAYWWATKRSKTFFNEVIPTVIQRAWWFCITVGVVAGVAAFVTIFYKPGLKPPTTSEFQLFNKHNILEKWDLDFKHRFRAEIAASNKQRSIDALFLFGFKATDPGNRLNPDDQTKAVSRDGDFDMTNDQIQDWLRKFFKTLNESEFVNHDKNSLPCLMSDDDIHRYIVDMVCRYVVHLLPANVRSLFFYTCCLASPSSAGLRTCAELSQPALPKMMSDSFIRSTTFGSPVYEKSCSSSTCSVIGYRFDVRSILNHSLSYGKMRTNYDILTSFIETQLKSAPVGLRSGFVSGQGYFEFYDLQYSLASGTSISVSLSVGVSFLVVLMAMRNVLIAIYAIGTIILAIACTVSSLVLMGWKLNIVESLTITLAVGMSIDFTIHYGVVYQLSSEPTSAGRTRESFILVGSAVAAAAWTTFCAGIAVLNCSVDPYRKLGVFLVLVMLFSWTYATFFFQSLCHIIGPVGNFCQITCPKALVRLTRYKSDVGNKKHKPNDAS